MILLTFTPTLSLVIAAFDDWGPLNSCLASLAEQIDPPPFEVIVVDDGSKESAPDYICEWQNVLSLTIVRQVHIGASAARNHGIRLTKADLLLFVDADSKLQKDCLRVLAVAAQQKLESSCFQLRLIGGTDSTVGRAEQLRLLTIQNHMTQASGNIRYLNTAGFAIRRSQLNRDCALFDVSAMRGEDTLLLVSLIQEGALPWFVSNAVVEHAVPLTLWQYLQKAIRSAYVERGTYALIRSKGVRIRVSNSERLQMVVKMWEESGQPTIGRTAFFVLIARQFLPRMVSLLSHLSYSSEQIDSPE